MSDLQLKEEITQILSTSGYASSREILCPIIKIVSMRHQDVSHKQIYKVAKSIL